jgi:hypothetical protein
MKKMGALVGLIVTLGIAWWIFKAEYTAGPEHGAPPKQIIDVTGIRADLLSIGQAERMYLASHGTYATLDQLQQDGLLLFSPTNRRGYNFTAEISDGQHFKITATPSDASTAGWPTLSIDDSMQITQGQ